MHQEYNFLKAYILVKCKFLILRAILVIFQRLEQERVKNQGIKSIQFKMILKKHWNSWIK
jgi:hypothetical protein